MSNRLLISRRAFLRSTALVGASMSLQALTTTCARASGNDARLLIINLNGGLDGLSALQPSSGAAFDTLRSLRPTLAMNPASLLSLPGSFGLHPRLTTMRSLYEEGSMAAILKVGCRNMSRSHLEAEIALTRGVTDRMSATSSGLINRIGSQYGWSSLRAIGVTGDDPIFAGGDFRAVQARSLDDLYFRAFDGNYSAVDQLIGATYDFAAGGELDASKSSQNDYVRNLQTVIDGTDSVQSGVKGFAFTSSYPSTQFGKALRSAEIAFSAPQINSQVVYMRVVGFDTHSTQAPTLDRQLQDLDSSLSVLVGNAKTSGLWNNLIVLIVSEFGRTNAENGSGGTEHGGANTVMAFGGRVNGGAIIGSITPSSLTDYGWLQPEFNYAELYRRALVPIGVDPDRIIPVTDGPSLAGLFK